MNLNVRRRALTEAIGLLPLPPEYQRVEYIGARNQPGQPGGAFLDTGIYLSSADEIYVDCRCNYAYSQLVSGVIYGIMGARSSYGQYNMSIFQHRSGLFAVNIASSYSASYVFIDNAYDPKQRLKIINNKYRRGIIDVSVSDVEQPTLSTTKYSCCIFKNNGDNDASAFGWSGDIYAAIIRHKFYGVPCYRKSDNVIGMYDLAGRRFLTNKGNMSFIKGDDIV